MGMSMQVAYMHINNFKVMQVLINTPTEKLCCDILGYFASSTACFYFHLIVKILLFLLCVVICLQILDIKEKMFLI